MSEDYTESAREAIRSELKALVQETGRGKQICNWCLRVCHNIGESGAVQHFPDCPSHIVIELLAEIQRLTEARQASINRDSGTVLVPYDTKLKTMQAEIVQLKASRNALVAQVEKLLRYDLDLDLEAGIMVRRSDGDWVDFADLLGLLEKDKT